MQPRGIAEKEGIRQAEIVQAGRVANPLEEAVQAPRSSKGDRTSARGSPCRPPIRGERRGRPADSRAAASAILDRLERATDRDVAVRPVVERAQAGDALAFAELYVLFFDRVYRYVLVALKNAEDAQDVAQDVFERLLTVLDRFDPERGEFRPWLFGVVRNVSADHLRSAGRLTAVGDTPSHAAPIAARAGSLLERLDPDAGVRARIVALPETQRRVLVLRFVFDMTPAEIAEVVGSSVDAVRHVQHRALKSLAGAITREAA
jgi:RNA polymerase sigma-70 factor (ECF subfamily)